MRINKKRFLFMLYFVLFELVAIISPFLKLNIYSTDFRTLCIFAWMLFVVLFTGFKIPKQLDKIEKFIICFLISVAIEIIFSKLNYGQSWFSSIKMGYFYLVFGGYFLLDKLIRNTRDYENFRNAFKIFVIFFSALGILIPSYRFLFYESLISLPLFFESFYNKKSLKNFLYLLITIIYMIISGDNLSKRLILVACLIVEILIHTKSSTVENKKQILKKNIKTTGYIVLILAVAFYLPIKNFINQLISSDVGLQVRVEAYSYYFGQFISKPIFGMGLIDPTSNIANQLLVSGVRSNGLSQYYLDDIGIIGFVNQFGIIGIILLIYLIKTLIQFIKGNNKTIITENLILFIVYLIMNIALLPTSKTVLPMFVVMLVLMKKNKQFNLEVEISQ